MGTIATESALVRVRVAGRTLGKKPHPCVVQVLGREKRAFRRCNVLHGMTGATGYASVLSFKWKSRCSVVESLWRRIPMNHLEINAIMVRVALDACGPRRALAGEGCMKTMVPLDLIGDLTMAVHTFE